MAHQDFMASVACIKFQKSKLFDVFLCIVEKSGYSITIRKRMRIAIQSILVKLFSQLI